MQCLLQSGVHRAEFALKGFGITAPGSPGDGQFKFQLFNHPVGCAEVINLRFRFVAQGVKGVSLAINSYLLPFGCLGGSFLGGCGLLCRSFAGRCFCACGGSLPRKPLSLFW